MSKFMSDPGIPPQEINQETGAEEPLHDESEGSEFLDGNLRMVEQSLELPEEGLK